MKRCAVLSTIGDCLPPWPTRPHPAGLHQLPWDLLLAVGVGGGGRGCVVCVCMWGGACGPGCGDLARCPPRGQPPVRDLVEREKKGRTFFDLASSLVCKEGLQF